MSTTTDGTGHAHVVQLYPDAASLAEQVVPYLADGLAADESVIVIAAAGHLARFRRDLAPVVDVDAAVAAGQLALLDATATLDRFMGITGPDPQRFDAVIGATIRAALERGPVRAYGEMVDVLWQAGNVVAAMDLESLWQGLQATNDFTLYCAYAADAVGSLDGGATAVCGLHDHTVGTVDLRASSTSQRFLPHAGAVAAARQFVADWLAASSARTDDVVLAVSELVTNAIVHVGAPFHVSITDGHEGVRVAVADTSHQPPQRRPLTFDTPGGRGVHIVAALANAWGVDHTGDGKLVWADFHR